MAFLERCCCCGLPVSAAVLGVYLLVAYVISFMIELWWILETPDTAPIPTYLLCFGFFVLSILSGVLLYGISVKRTTYLLIWMFMMGVLLGPEAGMVLYLSIHHWRITSLYGLIEVTCWACRLLVNITGIICVQSLYSTWHEEKSVLLRLQALKMSPVPKLHQSRTRRSSAGSLLQGNSNLGYTASETKPEIVTEKDDVNQYPHIIYKNSKFDNFFESDFGNQNEWFSEFNASSFDPTIIDARLKTMPYLTVRHKPKELEKITEETETETDMCNLDRIPKTRSLLDLTETDYNNTESVKSSPNNKSISLNYVNFIEKQEKNTEYSDNLTRSLDRKIIKNKNLKILKKFSPFFSKKSIEEINIYQINPPKCQKTITDKPATHVKNLDTQLNQVYSHRGMYAFDERSKKVVFYPPEFFNKAEMQKFHNRMDSYGSSPSRSSLDNDSEDITQISDVAL